MRIEIWNMRNDAPVNEVLTPMQDGKHFMSGVELRERLVADIPDTVPLPTRVSMTLKAVDQYLEDQYGFNPLDVDSFMVQLTEGFKAHAAPIVLLVFCRDNIATSVCSSNEIIDLGQGTLQ